MRRYLPRFSLRALLGSMLVASLATQACISFQRSKLQRRREILLPDLEAQVITSQSIEDAYAQRFLQLMQRRIDQEASVLSAAEQQQWRQRIAAEQATRRQRQQRHD